jgi:zinc transport system substrate-binding protein
VLRVFVTILPQAYFVERVGGDHVSVDVMVGPGQSYHSYEPTPRQIARLSDAQVYFTIGVPFEETIVQRIRVNHPRLAVVDTREGIKLRPSDDHCEDGGHHHAHEEQGDPHIWLDPKLVSVQAGTIASALARLDPAHAVDYRSNCRRFQSDLDAVHARIAGKLAPFKGQAFFVFHPSFGYFADAYGLKQLAVEESGKEPGGRELAELIEQARRSSARTIFVQPQFAWASARTVAAAIGGKVVSLDPLAKDYLANLDDMAGKIAASFGAIGQQPPEALTQVRR